MSFNNPDRGASVLRERAIKHPLLLLQIAGMDQDQCFARIRDNYGVSSECIFRVEPRLPDTDRRWKRSDLVRLALMRLEGIHIPEITRYFVDTFAERPQPSEPSIGKTTHVNAKSVETYLTTLFSEQLTRAFHDVSKARYEYKFQHDDLLRYIQNIVEKTTIPREELFAPYNDQMSSSAFENSFFSVRDAIITFYLRLQSPPVTYRTILRTIKPGISDKDIPKRTVYLINKMGTIFTKDALETVLTRKKGEL
jgi:hypothetical protein